MEENQRKALKEGLTLIPTLIDIYDEDTSEIDATDAYFMIHTLLKIIDKFVGQTEARGVLNLLTEAKDIAEDEAESLDSEGNLNKRYGDLYKRVEVLETKLDNKPLGKVIEMKTKEVDTIKRGIEVLERWFLYMDSPMRSREEEEDINTIIDVITLILSLLRETEGIESVTYLCDRLEKLKARIENA